MNQVTLLKAVAMRANEQNKRGIFTAKTKGMGPDHRDCDMMCSMRANTIRAGMHRSATIRSVSSKGHSHYIEGTRRSQRSQLQVSEDFR